MKNTQVSITGNFTVDVKPFMSFEPDVNPWPKSKVGMAFDLLAVECARFNADWYGGGEHWKDFLRSILEANKLIFTGMDFGFTGSHFWLHAKLKNNEVSLPVETDVDYRVCMICVRNMLLH